MKKVLSLVLAVGMVLGTCTMAMASSAKKFVLDPANLSADSTYFKDDDGKIVDTITDVNSNTKIVPGTTLYFKMDVVDSANSNAPATKLSDLSNYKISYTTDEGKNMVAGVKFVQMTVAGSTTKNLYLAVSTKDNQILEDQDVSMTIKISGVNGAVVGTTANGFHSFDLGFTAGYETTPEIGNGFYTVSGAKIATFGDDADDVTLCFDKDVEVAGNMVGQKDVYLNMKTSDDTLEEKYPDATLRLFVGDKDTFKRELSVTIPYTAEGEKAYIYSVDAKGVLTTVKGAKFADDKFTFKTNTLANYVISDSELKSVVAEDDKTENSTTTDKENNPETGANDFVGLAVAMAVVSIAGIAVAKRK